MSELLPLATYNLKVEPYTPTPAIDVTVPVTVRITLAAVDPEAVDKENKPSTLRIIKRNPDFDDDEDDILGGDFDEDELDNEESEEEEEQEEEKPAKKSKGKSKKQQKKEQEEEEEDESEGSIEEEEAELDDEFQEYVVLTLSPKVQFQQTLDLVIAPEEEVQFVLTGSYPIHLTGNYVKHPFDQPQYGDDDSEEEDSEEYDSEEYDLTPDEDELLDDLEDVSDVESRIEELVQQDEQKNKNKNKNKKRKQDEKEDGDEEKAPEQPKETKKAKKEEPKKDKKEKKVEFKKNLEEGPSKKATKEAAKETKPKTQALEGGIIVEDRVIGQGKTAKRGSKVGMRYIGKLKNGKVFDKNTSGKPFNFNLGRGEVIKGWDIGVAGMAVGGERRIVIPAPYAYGKQALPGIPANSELTFDVKLVSMK